jgi:integrase
MASIVQRGDSLYIHYSVDGILFRKSLKLKVSKENRRLAENKRYEIEDMILNNILPTDVDLKIERVTTEQNKKALEWLTNKSLHDYAESFLSDKPNSINRKVGECAYKKFQEVINTSELKVNEVTEFVANTYQDYLIEKKLSYNTQRTYINYMNIMFGYFIKKKIYTDENPFVRLKRKDSKFITTIKDEHMKLILEYLKKNNTELYRFINFLRLTGFRLNEGLQLEWNQIKWKENVISLTTFKDNNRNDIFPLEIERGELKRFLLSFKQENGKMFKLNREYILKPFQKCIVAINKEQKEKNKKWIDIPRYTIHEIRKSFGSKYASKLKPISLMKLMRHSNIETTLRYYIQLDVVDIAKELNKL